MAMLRRIEQGLCRAKMRPEMLQRLECFYNAISSHLIGPIERSATRRREPNSAHHSQVELTGASCTLDFEQLRCLDHHRQDDRRLDLGG